MKIGVCGGLARAIAGGSAFGMVVAALIVGPAAGSASATPVCEDGSRESAAAVEKAGAFTVPVPNVISGPNTEITLRFSAGDECAWGLLVNTGRLGPDDRVWLDRSGDGGRTWDPELGERSRPRGTESTYTAAYRAGGSTGYSIRACGRGSWEETVDEGMLIPGPFGRVLNDAPEYETRYYNVVCTNWFPWAAPGADTREGQTAATANWSPRDFFFDADDRQIPLRVGWQDPTSPDGFGWLHIQARHPGQYDEGRVEDVLENCDPVPAGANLRCEDDGYVVVYSTEYTEDSYMKGIITVFQR